MAILKPLKVNLDNLDLDTMELFFTVQETLSTEGKANPAVLKQLFAGMFEDWTLADAGKLTRAELPQVMDALGEAFNQSVPLDTEGS